VPEKCNTPEKIKGLEKVPRHKGKKYGRSPDAFKTG